MAALASLTSRVDGLVSDEAARRYIELGPNRVEAVAHEPLWLSFGREFTHFFALILWVAAGLAWFIESREPGQGMAQLALAMGLLEEARKALVRWHIHRKGSRQAALLTPRCQ